MEGFIEKILEKIFTADFSAFFKYLFVNQFDFIWEALIASVLIGILCALIGSFVLLRGMVFLGQAIAHSAFAGAALAILLGVDPLLVILLFSVVASLGIGYVNEKKIMREEIIIGVVFSWGPALAILFISLFDVYSTDVNSILFGNILIISKTTFSLLVIFSIIVFAIILGLKKEYYLLTFDEESAIISGFPVKFLNYLFLILISITISVSLRAIGAILVFAMIVTPAAAAYQWTYRFNKLLILSGIFGVFSMILGLYLSVTFDLPSGSTIVTAITTIFFVSFILSPKRRFAKITNVSTECRYCSEVIAEDGTCEEPDCPHVQHTHIHAIDDDKGKRGEVVIRKKDLEEREPSSHEH